MINAKLSQFVRKPSYIIYIYISIALVAIVGALFLLGQNLRLSAMDESVGESIQVVMQELCKEEVQRYCSSAHGVETYSCIKSIDPKFLSAKCLSTFQ